MCFKILIVFTRDFLVKLAQKRKHDSQQRISLHVDSENEHDKDLERAAVDSGLFLSFPTKHFISA